MDLQSHSHSVFGNDPPGPAPGCPREEMCTTEPCENQGQCQGGWQGFTCACTDSFTDKTCSSGTVNLLESDILGGPHCRVGKVAEFQRS